MRYVSWMATVVFFHRASMSFRLGPGRGFGVGAVARRCVEDLSKHISAFTFVKLHARLDIRVCVRIEV